MRPGTILLAAALLGLLAFAGYRMWEASLSDEERIRRRLQDHVTSFNGTELDCANDLHPDFIDRTTGLKRDRLRAAMLYVFRRDYDLRKGGFVWRLEIPDADVDVTEIDTDAGSARAKFRVSLFRSEGTDPESLHWAIDVDATFERTEREGWQLRESRHETLHGARPR